MQKQNRIMADKSPTIIAQVKIGHYVLGDTLGVGTFGKVKSKLFNVFNISIQSVIAAVITVLL